MARTARDTQGRYLPATVARGGRTITVRTVAGSRTKAIAKRAGAALGSAAAKMALSEKHTLTALAAAAVLGAAKRTDTDLPTLGGIQPEVLYGLAAWGYGKYAKSLTASHVGTGLLCVALYNGIAYTRETREQLDALVTTQAETARAEDDEEESSTSRGVVGDLI